MTNLEIGHELHLAPGTVKSHLTSIYGKLGVSNRTQAAVTALHART
jgi:DNA-binding NarL/FixJ family response regulator